MVVLQEGDGCSSHLQVEDGCPTGGRWLFYRWKMVILQVVDGCPTGGRLLFYR